MPSPVSIGSPPPTWLARTWELGGIVGAAAVLVTAAILWLAAGAWLAALDRSLGLTSNALEATTDAFDVVEGTLTVLIDSSDRLERSVLDAGATSEAVSTVVAQTADLLTEQLPEDIDAIRASLEGLIDTAGVIDGIMRTLSLVGVDYDPVLPLDQALADLDARIATLPDRLRGQAESLSDTAEGIGSFGDDAAGIAGDLGALREQMETSQEVIDSYRETTAAAISSVDSARRELVTTRGWLRAAAIAGAVVGLLVMSAVWWLGRSARPGR